MPGVYAVFHKQLGDLVLLQPTLDKLRQNHGGQVRLITRKGHAPLVELMEGIEMAPSLPLRPLKNLFAFDSLRKTAWRSLLAPARQKFCLLPAAHEKQWFAEMIFSQVALPGLGDEYIAEYFWRNTPGNGPAEFPPPRLRRPPDSWRPSLAPSAPFIALNPTAGWPQKSWLPKSWAGFVRELFGASPPLILVISGPADWQIVHARETQRAIGPETAPLASGLTLREFLWLCSRAEAMLTVDGAASHLAAAFEVPTFTLFGSTSSTHWHRPGPLAAAVRAPAGRDGRRRMKYLAAGETAAAARSWLSQISAVRDFSRHITTYPGP